MSASESDPGQLATNLQALSLDDEKTVSKANNSAGKKKSQPQQVDCRPWPPLEEFKHPRTTAVFYYAIYIREHKLEEIAVRHRPYLAGDPAGGLLMEGLFALRELVDEPTLAIHFGLLMPRHKEAMPCIAEKAVCPILCMFQMNKKAFEKRLTGEKVDRLVRELDCKPDWYEISSFL